MSICEKHIWPTLKLILSAGTPIQNLIDRGGETHLFINNQAINILFNDNRRAVHKLIDRYRTFIDLGNLWADKGCKCFSHYYRPESGKGFIPWISAVNECLSHFNKAVFLWKNGKSQKSMFYLGATAHIVQDMCVPHHSMGIAFNGHGKFELWAMANKENFKLEKGGFYNNFNSIIEIIEYNSNISKHFYNDVSHFNTNRYYFATKELLPLAQATTACLFDHFFNILL
ncbi:MAG: zinc dependent phospholipase C family protein [Peptococcaceae bacterium]|nr:zinc dependent phospholipase C family protein [Peptococcaceae bacterium]